MQAKKTNSTIYTTLFYLTTWGYLLLNIAIAYAPAVSSLLLALRDSWIFLLLYAFIKSRRWLDIYVTFLIIFIGFIGFFDFISTSALFIYLYGLRDILLYFLVGFLLTTNEDFGVSIDAILKFTRTIIFLAAIDLLFLILLNKPYASIILGTENYFASKNVDSNLSSGIIGDRLSTPLYSPALVCSVLASIYIFYKNTPLKIPFFEKFLALLVCIFTVSKVLIVFIFFRVIGRRWMLFSISIISLIPLIYIYLINYLDSLEAGFLSYHLGSSLFHIEAFAFALELGFTDIHPDLLGSHSVIGKNMLELDIYTIESSLLARVLDLKVYSVIFILWLFFIGCKLKASLEGSIFSLFMIVSALTATSNHPIAYIIAIYTANHLRHLDAPSNSLESAVAAPDFTQQASEGVRVTNPS